MHDFNKIMLLVACFMAASVSSLDILMFICNKHISNWRLSAIIFHKTVFFSLQASKLQTSHYINISTDILRTARGILGIRGTHFGKRCSRKVVLKIYHSPQNSL